MVSPQSYTNIYIQQSNTITNMLAPRRNNDLDNFISQYMHPTHNQAQTLTPRNTYTHANVQQDRPHDRNDRTISPNRISNTRKPMISPARTAPKQNTHEQCCANENHRNKKAEYMIRIEDQDMYYCGICATQAASQGFTVTKINAPKRQKAVPNCPELASNPRYQHLTSLMRDILWLETEYKRKGPKLVEEHYRCQEEILSDFYNKLLTTVEGLRDDHLRQFRQQQARSVAASEMHYSNLGMHLEDLSEAWDDIEETFQDVLQKIDPQSFQDGMRTYRNTISVFRHKLEEFEDIFAYLPTYDEAELTEKLRQAQESILNVWRAQSVEQPTVRKGMIERNDNKTNPLMVTMGKNYQLVNIKKANEGFPKPSSQSNEGQSAFRNLFPDDEESEQRLPATSPQFKKF